MSEDAERKEIRRGIDDGNQIGNGMETSHGGTRRRIEEDLDRQFEGPKNPKNNRRTSTEKQSQDHGNDHDRHGILRLLMSMTTRLTSDFILLSQSLRAGLQSMQGTNQLQIEEDDHQGRQGIDEESIEEHVGPTIQSTFGEIAVAFGDQHTRLMIVFVDGRIVRGCRHHLIDIGHFNDFVFEEERNGIDEGNDEEKIGHHSRSFQRTEALAVDGITDQDPPIHRHRRGDPQGKNATARCQTAEDDLHVTKEDRHRTVSLRLNEIFHQMREDDRNARDHIRERQAS